MTPKERMLLAISGEKPDRLPVSIHQWQPYHLEEYMNAVDALDAFKATGMDAAIQYFEAMGQFWIPEAEKHALQTPKWRDEITVVDQSNILTSGTKEQIRAEVYRLFEGFGRDGGYIMSASDHFFNAPPENLQAFADAAKECVY